jgi:hypothetical protein
VKTLEDALKVILDDNLGGQPLRAPWRAPWRITLENKLGEYP